MIPLISTVLQDDGERSYRLVYRSSTIIKDEARYGYNGDDNEPDIPEEHAFTKIISPRQVVEPEYSLTSPLKPPTYIHLLAERSTVPSFSTTATPTPTHIYSGHFNPSHKSNLTLTHTPSSLPTPWILVLASMLLSLFLGVLAKRSNHPDFATPSGFWLRLPFLNKSFKARKVYNAERNLQKKLDKVKEIAERKKSNNQNGGMEENGEKTPEAIMSPIPEEQQQEEEEQTIDDLPLERSTTTTTNTNEIFISAPTSLYTLPNMSTTPSNISLVLHKHFYPRTTLSLLVTTYRSILSLAILIYCITSSSPFSGPYPPPSLLLIQIIAIQLALSNNHIPQIYHLIFSIDLFIASIAFVLSTTLAMNTYARYDILGGVGHCPVYHPNCIKTYPSWTQIGCGAVFPSSPLHNNHNISTSAPVEGDGEISVVDNSVESSPFMHLHTYEGAMIIVGSTWLFTVAVYLYIFRRLLCFRTKAIFTRPITVEKRQWKLIRGIALVGMLLAVGVMVSSVVLHYLHGREGKGAWVVDGVGGVVNITDTGGGGGGGNGSWSDCFWVGVENNNGRGMGVKEMVEDWRKADKGLTMIRLMGLI